MNGSEHYKLGETLLASAWKRSAADDTVFINTPERRAELIATARAHFAAAQAAATALPTVVAMMGDSTEVTAWAHAIGAVPEPDEPDDVPEAVILPASWPPVTGDAWNLKPVGRWISHAWFAQNTPDGIRMVPTYISEDDFDPDAALTPEELLKRGELKLLYRNPWEPPF